MYTQKTFNRKGFDFLEHIQELYCVINLKLNFIGVIPINYSSFAGFYILFRTIYTLLSDRRE